MIKFEQIVEANKKLITVDIKGKDYVAVNERIKAFRMVHPNGCIETDIVSLDNGVVTVKAFVYDDEGRKIGTGLAQEKESSSYINKTSFIENAETSAVGRALGMCGFGIDTAVCSAEEVTNAINNQGKRMIEEDSYYDALLDLMAQKGVTAEQIFKRYKVWSLRDLSDRQYTEAAAGLQKMKDVSNDDAS